LELGRLGVRFARITGPEVGCPSGAAVISSGRNRCEALARRRADFDDRVGIVGEPFGRKSDRASRFEGSKSFLVDLRQ
jgi:hypothetical protein